jgi:lipopolysaccharide/colanic/teichoic acid biosynthesis glycosyltransferase
VHGRNTVSWQDKFKMDVEYVDHITFLGDLKIVWDSVMVAFVKRDGIIATSRKSGKLDSSGITEVGDD